MTVYGGMLLFDIAEEPINDWENQLGYRGYMEVWKRGEEEIKVEMDEDSGVWEVIYENDNIWEMIDCHEDFDEADKIAKAYMKEN
jgi:nuclear transport factor 2 (NTF2) superfamily protein